MNKIGQQIKEQVIEILKQEMNHTEPLGNYSQWLMGVSVARNESKDKESTSYTARMVTNTNQSKYVDGMDIQFTEVDNGVIIDPFYYENTPDLMGSPIRDSIKWLLELNREIIYLEQLDPHRELLYIKRLKEIVGEYSFETLSEYTLDNNRMNLVDLYKDLLQETLLRKVMIEGEEVRPCEYKLSIVSNNRPYTLSPKSSFTKDEVIEEIKEKIIKEIVAGKTDDEDDNFEKYRQVINKTSSI